MKQNADGRKDGSNGQRGILGFEWRTAPLPYNSLPIDEERSARPSSRATMRLSVWFLIWL